MNAVMAVDMAGQFAGQRDEAIELATDLGDEVGFPPRARRRAQRAGRACRGGCHRHRSAGRAASLNSGEVEVQPERQVDFDRTAGGRFCVDAVDQQRGRADGAGGEAVEDAGVAFGRNAEVVGVDDQERGRAARVRVRSIARRPLEPACGEGLHWFTSPESKPARNQRTRCAELPCVKLSGAMRPRDCCCRRSSPIAAAPSAPVPVRPAAGSSSSNRRVFAPDAGETVRLQFETHRQRIALGLADAAALRLDLARDAEQVLHMVADLVCDHVGLREFAGAWKRVFRSR